MKPLTLALIAAALAACSTMHNDSSAHVRQRPFGIDQHGQPVTLWTLATARLEIDVTDHGATIVAVRVPDPAGTLVDVALGFDDVRGYESDRNQYFGCTTGRVCNRIGNARFTLDGQTWLLADNDGPNSLHGGARRSLDKVHWRGEVIDASATPAIRFTYRSPDGEEGYPGNLDIAVTFRLDAEGLHIDSEARTDARTPVNLTNHTYWNLAGEGTATVLDHELWIAADHFTPVDEKLIPTGAIVPVTPALDFRRPMLLGHHIQELDDTTAPPGGYDLNYALNGTGMRHVATVRHVGNGRGFELWPDQPGLQLYSGNFLDGKRQIGKNGKPYRFRSGLCLETQHYPDSVNHANFPSTILAPGEVYRTTTSFRFFHR
jgi:aldose 1-epimerase